jgi:hypothetical protein
MSEALRRAAERVLTGSAISAGSKQFHDDVRLLARQAPEPVAPYLWEYTYAANGNTVLDREEPLPELVASGVFTNIKPLYTHPAGMDAARAKAIEECLQVAQDMLYAGPTAIIAAIRALKEAR